MGKSSFELVASREQTVVPARGVPKQPAYVRGRHSVQTSPRLLAFQACVANKLAGSKPGNRMAVREALAAAAHACRGGGK